MSEREEPIVHLLIPKEYRVWCIGMRRPPGPKMAVTALPSKATCVVCLTNYRYSKGHRKAFKVKWTSRHEPIPQTPALKE